VKKCTRCKLEKPLEFFYREKKTKDGLKYFCKKCSNECKQLHNKGLDAKTQNRMPRSFGYGKGYIHASGYKLLPKRDHANSWKSGMIGEHTVVMSEFLKRPLSKTETVHHKNGIRSDNRIENLELWDKRHGPGQRVEDKVKWCIEFLKEYGYKVIKE
jgi:HNH endonuclease